MAPTERTSFRPGPFRAHCDPARPAITHIPARRTACRSPYGGRRVADMIYFLLICISLFMAVGVSVYALFGSSQAKDSPSLPAATEFERSMMRALNRMTRMGE